LMCRVIASVGSNRVTATTDWWCTCKGITMTYLVSPKLLYRTIYNMTLLLKVSATLFKKVSLRQYCKS
jgi:hypothetical protein